jgi:hypothetical protein
MNKADRQKYLNKLNYLEKIGLIPEEDIEGWPFNRYHSCVKFCKYCDPKRGFCTLTPDQGVKILISLSRTKKITLSSFVEILFTETAQCIDCLEFLRSPKEKND